VLAHFRNLKVYSIVNGIRGGPKLDASKVVDIVLALQALMIDDPSVAEIEINPLIMTETGAVAVDALIRRAP
jgi:succinyl-CoA synthetase beta subunit